MEGFKRYINDLRRGHGIRLIMLVLGGLLLVFPGTAQKTLANIIAIAFVIMGVVKILSYFGKPKEDAYGYMEYKSKSVIVIGILYIVLAALIAKVLISIIPILLGIIIALNGIIKLQYSLEVKKNIPDSRWQPMLLAAVIMLAVGVVILLNPFKTNNLIIRIIGGILVFESIFDLAASYKYAK
ncbi:MAG: DUF308 domain-containing protein [Clostridium sp.]|nr:DUF308 domain-containing protein [Clostridium sp.]